ncbi:MAG: hypothetical protein EOO29_52205, partial [Comamonadaceae bacterium]
MNTRTVPFVPGRRALIVAAPALLLAGCGFRMRQAAEYPFKSIAVVGSGLLAATIRRELKGQGPVTVLEEGADYTGAEVVCQLQDQSRSSGIAASTSGGQIRELTLSLNVRYRLVRTQGAKELIAPTSVQQSRDISYNETSALAKENEQELLYRDMTIDIAQQIVR